MHSLHQPSLSTTSQRNSLYGAFEGLDSSDMMSANQQAQAQAQPQAQHQHHQSHLNELAKLQQADLFESQQQASSRSQVDMSLYSPSSSTSLLYHIYDQINLPAEQHLYQQQQQQQHQIQAGAMDSLIGGAKKGGTTILNPANLFGPSQQQQQQQQQQQHQQQTLPLPMHHYYASSNLQCQAQQPMQTSQSSYLASANQQQALMLDTVLRQQHARNHQRPLSSSAGSSMSSGAGANIAYGRHQRLNHNPTSFGATTASPAILNGLKSASGAQHQQLAGLLQPGTHHTLAAHLSAQARLSASLGVSRHDLTASGRPPSSMLNGKSSLSSSVAPTPLSPLFANRWTKQAGRTARQFIYQYRTIIKCSSLLVLLALALMSVIKFTLLSSTLSSPTTMPPQVKQAPTSSNPPSAMQANNFISQNLYNLQNSAPSSNSYPRHDATLTSPAGQPNDLTTPPLLAGLQAQPQHPMPLPAQPVDAVGGQLEQPDVLKSKLLIGEFVILSQNYSQSATQKSLLAERIVKLMDQVFLSTEVQRVYSRTEITNITQNPSGGVVVDCNIILNESIAYAAQQFGIALYDSLSRSQERLANQANYIIDKNSIRFNTVPDKDLKSGIVPPGLISAAVSRELEFSPEPAPSGGQQQPALDVSNLDQLNSVVWSEWSQWSSCVGKNGVCDPTRLHSRLRRCVAQHTGEKVDAGQCRQRFNSQDLELEVDNCAKTCLSQPDSLAHIMSDAPSVIGPQTAPSVLLASEHTFSALGPILSEPAKQQMASGRARDALESVDLAGQPAASLIQASSTTERNQVSASSQASNDILSSTPSVSSLLPQLEPNQQQSLSCSNCTSGEICLLLVQQKVPFCAKIKDRDDASGCGGWCNSQNQLCQAVGQNAFKCIHDSECLPEEWRCHDSACIPLSKRCDGHSNCYDSSDERDCPAPL